MDSKEREERVFSRLGLPNRHKRVTAVCIWKPLCFPGCFCVCIMCAVKMRQNIIDSVRCEKWIVAVVMLTSGAGVHFPQFNLQLHTTRELQRENTNILFERIQTEFHHITVSLPMCMWLSELSHCAVEQRTAARRQGNRWERWSRRARTSWGAGPSLPSVQTDWLAGKDPWSTLPGTSVRGTPSGQRVTQREGERETWQIYSHFMLPAVGSYSSWEQVQDQYSSTVVLSTHGEDAGVVWENCVKIHKWGITIVVFKF